MGDGVEYKPALQVIVLGSGGGPIESNTTAFLVRSTATNWERGSLLAVDAGVHLSAILKILETHPPFTFPISTTTGPSSSLTTLEDGPFKGLELPFTTKEANAAFITRNLVDTYLITHPHLDHISGFVVNTASLQGNRPKRLAGLPGTIDAFRNHIFNNVIWPNLSDENNGAGLVTYMRLVEGGSLAIGDGEARGYVEVCEDLSVKTWSVSHGHCMENHTHAGTSRGRSNSPANPYDSPSARFEPTPRKSISHGSLSQSARKSSTTSDLLRSDSFPRNEPNICVYNSSAYFIRSLKSSHEVLIFGDVEPDSISLSPRNKQVWVDAAPKIAGGLLRGIFIECSYSDEQSEETLFGHLAPRYLIEELKVLGAEVENCKRGEGTVDKERERKKRKRLSNGTNLDKGEGRRRSTRHAIPDIGLSGKSPDQNEVLYAPSGEVDMEVLLSPKSEAPLPLRTVSLRPLEGVKIVIIHVKDKLNDGPHISERILGELMEYEEEAGLGCEFLIAQAGQSVFL